LCCRKPAMHKGTTFNFTECMCRVQCRLVRALNIGNIATAVVSGRVKVDTTHLVRHVTFLTPLLGQHKFRKGHTNLMSTSGPSQGEEVRFLEWWLSEQSHFFCCPRTSFYPILLLYFISSSCFLSSSTFSDFILLQLFPLFYYFSCSQIVSRYGNEQSQRLQLGSKSH